MAGLNDIIQSIFGTPDAIAGPNSSDIERSINFIREVTGQAREDIFNISPIATQNALLGQQGALDIFKQSLPEQLRAFQSGNLNAQETQTAGLPQQINAILGRPTDLSGLKPKQTDVDLGFLQDAQLPDFNLNLQPAGANPGQVDEESLRQLYLAFGLQIPSWLDAGVNLNPNPNPPASPNPNTTVEDVIQGAGTVTDAVAPQGGNNNDDGGLFGQSGLTPQVFEQIFGHEGINPYIFNRLLGIAPRTSVGVRKVLR